MKTVADRAESSFARVIMGDFSRLKRPLLVACASWKQFDSFARSEDMDEHEIKRFCGDRRKFQNEPQNKILILLPGWHQDRDTARLVSWWAEEMDRYTCEITWPISRQQAREIRTLLILLSICLGAWIGMISWMIFR